MNGGKGGGVGGDRMWEGVEVYGLQGAGGKPMRIYLGLLQFPPFRASITMKLSKNSLSRSAMRSYRIVCHTCCLPVEQRNYNDTNLVLVHIKSC